MRRRSSDKVNLFNNLYVADLVLCSHDDTGNLDCSAIRHVFSSSIFHNLSFDFIFTHNIVAEYQ